MRREHKKKLSKAELEQITSRRPVTRRIPHRPVRLPKTLLCKERA